MVCVYSQPGFQADVATYPEDYGQCHTDQAMSMMNRTERFVELFDNDSCEGQPSEVLPEGAVHPFTEAQSWRFA